MKATVALLTAAISCVAAVPHVNHHHHLHQHVKRVPDTVTNVVPGPTETSYVLNGNPISEADVMQGIANGTLVWANGAPPPAQPSKAVEAPNAAPLAAPSSAWSAPINIPSPSGFSPPSGPPYSGGSDDSWSGDSEGVETPFPDGELDCSHFPSDYGAVSLDWLGLGGWSGVQQPGSNNGGYGDIMTVKSDQCSDGNCCTEGSFCSYACPAGYQKSQWPETQGSTGQSVGGIECRGGKLHLTNPSMSQSLCMKGASEVTVQVQNKLGQQVAVCRTDYPGTESETIPVSAGPGQTQELACPDADNYYNWQGAHTSAQYYVNPAGVSVQDGCQWGSSDNPWGNWAPLNLGVGYSNGAAWLSIFQNAPTTSATLDFSVEIQGDGMSGTCRYSNGQYCGGANYDDCSSTTGCTVSISSGTATFIFSN